MVVRVIHQTVIGKDDAPGTPGGLAQGVDIAFLVGTAGLLRQQSFPVLEGISADDLAGGIPLQAAALPTQRLGLGFGKEVFR